jgi:hypothetical protein
VARAALGVAVRRHDLGIANGTAFALARHHLSNEHARTCLSVIEAG